MLGGAAGDSENIPFGIADKILKETDPYPSKAKGRPIVGRPCYPFGSVLSDLRARNGVLHLTLSVIWTGYDQPYPVGGSCSYW